MHLPSTKSAIAVAVASALLVSACSSSTTPSSTASAGAGSTSTAATAPSPAAPKRIVSMSPSATEDLYAIGAGPQVVAVDSNSNYPANAPITKLSAYQPNVEAIAKYSPDLVVLSDDTNGVQAQLATLAIPVVLEPAAATLADAYSEITDLGAKTGHTDGAASVVATMKSKIAALTASVTTPAKPVTYYHELDNTLYTVTSRTFIGQLYALAGLTDIADAAHAKGGDYPQLSAEYLVKADPDLVFLADTKCCAQNAKTFAGRPGFAALSAVKNGDVIPLDDDIASRWGPRVVDLLQQIIAAEKALHTS